MCGPKTADTAWTICLLELYSGAANFMNVVSMGSNRITASQLVYCFFFSLYVLPHKNPLFMGFCLDGWIPVRNLQPDIGPRVVSDTFNEVKWPFQKYDKKNSSKSVA